MAFASRTEDGVTIIQASGHLEGADAIELSEYLKGLLEKPPEKLVLDLSQVTFLGSTGINALIATLKRTNQLDLRFAVCGLSPVLQETISVTNLDRVLPIFEDIGEAKEHVKS